MKITASEALQRLREGNRRFVSGVRSLDAMLSHRLETVEVDFFDGAERVGR